MNILFIEIASDGTVGGSHTCLFNLVSNLNSDKYKSHIGFYETNSYVDKFENIGVPVHLINRKPITHGIIFIRKLRNWYRLIYKHRKELAKILKQNKIDLVVLNNTIKYSNDIVSICNKNRIPIIAYERGHLEYNRLDIRLTNSIFASIAVSKAIESNMKKQQYRARTHVIYDGMPVHDRTNHFGRRNIADIKYDIDVPEDSIVVGIVGNIRGWKGQEYFVRAFMSLGEKYKNMYGLIIGGHGSEDDEYLKLLKNITERSEVGNRLRFLGFRDDVPELLRIMNVFIHASIKPEPFGMVLLEAMLYKVPVIATNLGGPIEILEKGHYGILVPPCDVDAIVDGVEKYLSNSTFREEVIEKAQKRVIEAFDQRKTIEMVEDLFHEAVANSNRSSKSIQNV